jgi:hypothetical protein
MQKALAGLSVIPGRALQRLNEPRKRSERRAQLVTRIGHEIRTHLFNPADRGEVMQGHQHQLTAAVSGQHDRLDETFEPAVGHADLKLEPLALPGCRCDGLRRPSGMRSATIPVRRRRRAMLRAFLLNFSHDTW